MFILIPSYKPTRKLTNLVHQLNAYYDACVLIIDDGSGPAYSHFYERLADDGCIVLTHETNVGRGAALKTGFEFLKEVGWEGTVVTAEGEGQHLASDIIRIGGRINTNAKKILLGSRTFNESASLRSRIGNVISSAAFQMSTGHRIDDTQTSLRAFDARMLDWLLQIPGNRLEYEMNMLLAAAVDRVPLEEIYIETAQANYYIHNVHQIQLPSL